MNAEIELKLAVYPDFVDFLSQALTNFHLLKYEKITLGNCYYDTSDQQLAKQKMGLRIRKHNLNFTLTLKTNGEVKGGLHLRPEYDVPLRCDIFGELELAELSEKSGVFLKVLSGLNPIFRTDFERQYWLVECGNGAVIEIAFDQGEIIAGQRTQPICEVEFELKQGRVQDLLNFVEQLGFENAVRLSSASKAKRGYNLANPAIAPIDWVVKWQNFLLFSKKNEKSAAVFEQLLQFEQDLLDETFSFTKEIFQQDFVLCSERISSLLNLFLYYQEQSGNLHAIFKQYFYITTKDFKELMENNQFFLEKFKQISDYCHKEKNSAVAFEELQHLLESRQYVNRLLGFIWLNFDR